MAVVTGMGPIPITEQARALKAGQEFEAVLLNTFWSELERSFSELPGGKHSQETQAYSGFGMQALTAGLARAGDVGVAGMVARALVKPHKTNAITGPESY